jgi:hypothetical protein
VEKTLLRKENEISKPKLVLVEGNHDKDFFDALVKNLGKDDIQVMQYQGKSNLRNYLAGLIKQANFPDVTSILIVRDADNNPNSAFDSVKTALQNTNLPYPKNSWDFAQNATPKVGIAILPNMDQTGALEELLLQTIDGDPMSEKSCNFIDDAIVTLDNSGYRSPPPSHRVGKAKIHAFLSTFKEPDKDPGKAGLANMWDFKHKALDPLRSILEEL